MKKITTLLVALLAFFALNLQGQNLVLNGDMESWDDPSTPTSWDKAENISQETSPVHGGTYSAGHTSANGTQDLQQVISGIVGGSTYTISYYFLDNVPNARHRIWSYWLQGTSTLSDHAAELRPGTYSSDDPNWQLYEVTLTAPATADGFRFEVRVYKDGDFGDMVYYDDFSMVEGSVIFPEPTNYPTAFTATAMGNTIDLAWTDAIGAQLPSAYIVYISDQDNIVAPVDGTPVSDDLDLSDGTGAKNVGFGQEAYTFSNLATYTTYYFAIYPYTNNGLDIDYKNDGTAPSATAATTSTVIYEDFDWSWMAWTPVSVTGTQVWEIDDFGVGNSDCAKMSGYSGGSNENEDWLISPPMNLDAYTNENLTFYTAMNYTGPDLVVKYSTDYDGGGDPSTASWTDISATLSAGGWAWTPSGDIDLSGVSGTNVYLAFVYTSTSSNSATWEVDNVLVTGDGTDPTGVVINEIMYDSPGNDEQWIELYNNTTGNIDVSGWYVQDNSTSNIPAAIPAGTILSPGQYYTISIYTSGSFPFTPDLDGTLQTDWSFNNNGDDANLYNLGRIRADHVPFLAVAPWPTEPAGNGPSCSLLDPDLDNSLGENWAASLQPNLGSPGSENFPPVPTILVTSPIGGEIWDQGSTHDITWSTIIYSGQVKIELIDTNTWAPQLLVSNISSSLNTWSWSIMSSQAAGDDYVIRISDLASGPVGESMNTFSIVEPYVQPKIVITEIMYNPPESGSDSLEFIELYNNGLDPVDLTGFEFVNGVSYIFPAVMLDPAEYLVVSVNSVAMMNTFGVTAYEWTSGALSNSGELIQLVDDGGMFVDSVRYDDHLPWDTLADGFGPSLTLCDPYLDNGLAENWAASTEFAAVNSIGDSIWATPLAGCAFIMPTANFKTADTTIVVGGTADFTDLSSGGTMVSWLWTFEGGTPGTSTDQNPTDILYDTQGAYDVTLEVENDFGETSTLLKTDYISVDFAPVADFEADATNPAVGQEVTFTDLSTGTITSWSWEFEGGTPSTSMLENPEPIVYAAVGLYDVTLTVANDYGEDIMLKEDYIDVHPIGISEMDADGLIKIYPNPAYGILNIENATGEVLTLSIYSLTGRQIIENRIQDGTTVINIDHLDAGIYFVRYLTESKLLKTGKLIIK